MDGWTDKHTGKQVDEGLEQSQVRCSGAASASHLRAGPSGACLSIRERCSSWAQLLSCDSVCELCEHLLNKQSIHLLGCGEDLLNKRSIRLARRQGIPRLRAHLSVCLSVYLSVHPAQDDAAGL
jgi:hypothetical protein